MVLYAGITSDVNYDSISLLNMNKNETYRKKDHTKTTNQTN